MDKEILEKYLKAGRIAAEALNYGKTLIKIGVSLLEVTELVEKKIKELGGDFAFPVQISLNNIAAHYCAIYEDKTIFKEGDVVKLDIGVHIYGYVGDSATTLDLGSNAEHAELLKASSEALNNAIKIIRPGITLGEIGKTIQETISSFGFSPIKNLSGHGLDKFSVHSHPSIPNFDTHDKTELKDDQVIAIEPFSTNGVGMIYESSNANIFALIEKRPVRSNFTREVLREIENYNDLPFTDRWLMKKMSPGKVRFALNEMKRLEMIKEYPPLPEKENGLVAQFEHSMIVKEKPIVFTRINE